MVEVPRPARPPPHTWCGAGEAGVVRNKAIEQGGKVRYRRGAGAPDGRCFRDVSWCHQESRTSPHTAFSTPQLHNSKPQRQCGNRSAGQRPETAGLAWRANGQRPARVPPRPPNAGAGALRLDTTQSTKLRTSRPAHQQMGSMPLRGIAHSYCLIRPDSWRRIRDPGVAQGNYERHSYCAEREKMELSPCWTGIGSV